MAWSDEPTEAQLNTIYRFIRWEMPNAEAIKAVNWLEERATRREVSDEIKRLKELYETRRLSFESCFESEIWEGYEYDGI